MLKQTLIRLLCLSLILLATIANATLTIPIFSTQSGVRMGEIKADDTIYGLLLTPHLRGLMPGIHGFHLNLCPMCGNGGWAAGGHFDPLKNDIHQGPYRGNGHLGDLPVLIVNRMGMARLPVLAPRLKLDMIKNHALVIDAHGDNYSDKPDKSGGGGARIACGVVPYFN